jgi:guanylate kinase
MKKAPGKLIVIVAPSGTGKSTLITKLKQEFPELHESVSFTTRGMRPGEINGVSYHFVTRDLFEKKIATDDFLEWALVHGEYKGTDKKVIQHALENGIHLLFDLDVQGADSIRAIFGAEPKIVFIEPPSVDELEKRLRGRNTETEEKIQTRLSNARKELARKNDYDYLVTNDTFDNALKHLRSIFEEILRS